MIHLIFIYFSVRSGTELISALANLLKVASSSYFLRKHDKTRAKSPSAGKMPGRAVGA
jgi:hypothetical protein